MTYRKTWFSYVLWVIYAGLCVMLLSFTGFTFWEKYIPVSMAQAGIFLIFPLIMGVYVFLRIISRKIRTKYTIQMHTVKMWEAFVVSFCFVFGTVYRLHAVLNGAFDLYFIESKGTEYFDMAMVRAGEGIELMAHGAGYLYVVCLSAVMSFLGNKIVSAMFLQTFLQIISLVLCYLIVKKAAGRLAACVTLIYMSFSSAYVSRIGMVDPECFYFLIYLFGMYLTVSFVKDYCRNYYGKGFAIWVFALLGIILGILVYLDLRSVTLLLFLIGIFVGKKQQDEELPGITVVQNILVFFVAVFFCVLTFFAAFLVDSVGYGTEYMLELSAWVDLYMTSFRGSVLFCMDQFMMDFPINGLLIGAASFLIFEFKRSGREQNYMLWILVCVCTAPTPMTGYGVIPYGVIALFVWCVLAGLGLQNCIMGGNALIVQAKIEEINASVESEEAARAEEPKEKPRFIENPLPLPKKHVKREMDFEYQVSPEDMKYDVEVDETDDFDI